MEAAPKLPMLGFDLKNSTENTSFSQPLKQYISQFYNENPESYNNEIHTLESLRGGAVRPSIDIEGCQLLKKYYCQLHFLKSRFPMEELQSAAVFFGWKDNYSTLACRLPDIRFELSCILYNIGAIHSQLGAMEKRTSSDGMKIACSHFQCAAWAFQMCRENYHQMITSISSIDILHFMEYICLAQAQECILEKSMLDNRKATIIAKVAAQVVEFYRKADHALQAGVAENSDSGFVNHSIFKEWVKYMRFKEAYHKCITLLFQGQQAEEQQKMGERVAFYEAAVVQLENARKLGNNLENKQEISEALSFTSDVVEGKKKAAKNDNEFIYHEFVPHLDTLPEIKGASLVKGTSFNVNDVEVSGPDIFSKLIPMEAHEASSLYSEKKAEVLRKYGEIIEEKDQKLAEFMSSLQIDFVNNVKQATGIPQEVVDRAAGLSAKPNAIKDLIDCMNALSSSYEEVESMINEIEELFKEEEKNENEYQKLMGERPASIIATDISREALKYKEAHIKANTSNQNLHKVIVNHVNNLKTLSQPLTQLQVQIPSVNMSDPNIDEQALKEIEHLIQKVEEMKTQRAVLWAQLRDAIHKDDITKVIVTRQSNQTVSDVFQQELQKHNQLTNLIEQNVAAQDNIMKALVDAHARFANTKRHLQGVLNKRSSMLSCLVQSYDMYEDLLSKAVKGKEFYNKLEANISKLLQRLRSACNVQQEERDQMLAKLPTVKKTIKIGAVNDSERTSAPKLRDYLESKEALDKTKNQAEHNVSLGNYQNTDNIQVGPTAVRLPPVGSEVDSSFNQYDMYAYNSTSYNNPKYLLEDCYNTNQYSNISYVKENSGYNRMTESTDIDQMLAKRLNNLNCKEMGNLPSDQVNQVGFPPQNYAYSTQMSMKNMVENKYAVPGPITNNFESNYSLPASTNSQYQPAETYSMQAANAIPASNPENFGQAQNWNASSGYNFLGDTSSGTKPPNQILNHDALYNQNNFSTYTHANMSNYSTNTAGYQYPANYGIYNQMQNPVKADQNVMPTSDNYVQDASQHHYYLQSSYQSVNQNMYQNIYSQSYTNPMNISSTYNMSNYAPNAGIMTSNTLYDSGVKYDNSEIPLPLKDSKDPTNNAMSNQYDSLPANQSGYIYTSYIPTQPNATLMQPVASYGNTIPSVIPSISNQQLAVKEEPSNIDLLCGLDFTINQAPLQPMTKPKENIENSSVKELKTSVSSVELPAPSITTSNSTNNLQNKSAIKDISVLPSKPLDNDDTKYLIKQEIDKFEKFVDVLGNKTLNGPTNIELKWKEIQDQQEKEGDKKIISVARCYPLKNRFSDILPYDFGRVVLTSMEDDYINATYIKEISAYVSPMLVTQAPLSSTLLDFWQMIVEHQTEFILCLQNDEELQKDIYWPVEKGKDLYVGNMKLSLQNITIKNDWIERLIYLSIPEKKVNLTIFHLQFNLWNGNLFPKTPEPFTSFIKYFISLHQQQKNLTRPFVIQCMQGIGRSGVTCLLIAAILELTNKPTNIPDLIGLANKITSFKKNILRDKEHLNFTYHLLLAYMRQMNSKGDSASESKQEINMVPAKKLEDPLSSLDPFWASKK